MGGGQLRSSISSFISLHTTTSSSSLLFGRCLQLPANLPLILAQLLINMFISPKTKVAENLRKYKHIAVTFSSAVPLNGVPIYPFQHKGITTEEGREGCLLVIDSGLLGGISLWIFLVRDEC